MGRFISADTIVPNPLDPQALNRYSYVLNNPIIYTDPSGQRNDPVFFSNYFSLTRGLGSSSSIFSDFFSSSNFFSNRSFSIQARGIADFQSTISANTFNRAPDFSNRSQLGGGGFFNSSFIGKGGFNSIQQGGGVPNGNLQVAFLTLDVIADVGFIGYDVYQLLFGSDSFEANIKALGADTVGLFIPFATGFGLAIRAGSKADKASDFFKGTRYSPKVRKQFQLDDFHILLRLGNNFN